MARLARVVVPGLPHHVTQRGNRRQKVFFGADDYALYKRLLREHARAAGVEIWAWCLMPNHVHLILVPPTAAALAMALREAHRRYTAHVNRRHGWTGWLWQGRFASAVLDQPHLLAAARYIERNPVRAGLAAHPGGWPFSSARAHLRRRSDGLVRTKPLLDLVPDWQAFLAADPPDDTVQALRRAQRTGRPLGDEAFLLALEEKLGRRLRRRKPGPKGQGEAA
ncbi:transposase [Marinimicrococcus flavescens]|uniref:Transposase n=1 Tax=Marinimicrococcus flavescens TaxID=3031815 RepID=A0AAP3UYZ7_9PROT|nr:transposase [Marinimicrococcus flavescens]